MLDCGHSDSEMIVSDIVNEGAVCDEGNECDEGEECDEGDESNEREECDEREKCSWHLPWRQLLCHG